MITFHVLTLFPESFPSILNVGLIGKAFQKNYSKLIQSILEIIVSYPPIQ
jgi:tRNA G37 N-methylase TrmD